MLNIPGRGMRTDVKKFLAHLDSIKVLPPDNGNKYILDTVLHVGEGEVVRISEKARNLAVIRATEKLTRIDAVVKAGYTLGHRAMESLGPNTKLTAIKDNLRTRFTNSYTVKVQKLQHFIERDACKALGIDAAWVLGHQVALFEDCRAKGDRTNAVRLLNDISYHVEVDSRVSNKLQIDTAVDYAELLSQANDRLEAPGLIIEHIPE